MLIIEEQVAAPEAPESMKIADPADPAKLFFQGKVFSTKEEAKTAIVNFCLENNIFAVFPYSDVRRIEGKCVGHVNLM